MAKTKKEKCLLTKGKRKRRRLSLGLSQKTSLKKKNVKKGEEKSWYVTDVFTEESEDDKDNYMGSRFKIGEASELQRVDDL